jgi:hypothetical protein
LQRALEFGNFGTGVPARQIAENGLEKCPNSRYRCSQRPEVLDATLCFGWRPMQDYVFVIVFPQTSLTFALSPQSLKSKISCRGVEFLSLPPRIYYWVVLAFKDSIIFGFDAISLWRLGLV